MNISEINSGLSSLGLNKISVENEKDNSFKDMLTDAMKDVNQQQQEGYNAMQEIATGKVTNLQEAIQQIEEAELSMKLALETKNKAINAYREVMRMQI